jgi:hypothetical protein
VNVGNRNAKSLVALNAISGDGLSFVGGIVQDLNFEQFPRVIELGDGVDEALDDVALVVNGELDSDARPFGDFRRRPGGILAVPEKVVDQRIAVNPVGGENHEHNEIGRHNGDIEHIDLIEALEWIQPGIQVAAQIIREGVRTRMKRQNQAGQHVQSGKAS